MIDVLTVIGSKLIGDVVGRITSGAFEWLKSKKNPRRKELKEKVEELASDAVNQVVPPEVLPAAVDRQRLVSGFTEFTMPTFDQVVKYSPRTAEIIFAAGRKAARKKSAAKRVWTVKKSAARPTHKTPPRKSPKKAR